MVNPLWRCYLRIFRAISVFGGAYFATFFTSDSSAIAQVGIALKIDGFIQPVLAISLILAGALQGMGIPKRLFTAQLLVCGEYAWLVYFS